MQGAYRVGIIRRAKPLLHTVLRLLGIITIDCTCVIPTVTELFYIDDNHYCAGERIITTIFI